MATIASYCPDIVDVLVAGFIKVDGFVDGTFVQIDKDEMPYSSIRMPDGTVSRKYNNSQTYTITITLHSAADANNLFTKLWQIDEVEYLVTALPASYALQFMEKYQEAIQTGKSDLATMREVIVKSVCKDNKQITNQSFDIIFARKFMHLSQLYQAVLNYNFEDVFTAPDSEE